MGKDPSSYRVPILRLKDLQKPNTDTDQDQGNTADAPTASEGTPLPKDTPKQRQVDTSTFTEKDVAEAVITPQNVDQPKPQSVPTQQQQTQPVQQPVQQAPAPTPKQTEPTQTSSPQPAQTPPPAPTKQTPSQPVQQPVQQAPAPTPKQQTPPQPTPKQDSVVPETAQQTTSQDDTMSQEPREIPRAPSPQPTKTPAPTPKQPSVPQSTQTPPSAPKKQTPPQPVQQPAQQEPAPTPKQTEPTQTSSPQPTKTPAPTPKQPSVPQSTQTPPPTPEQQTPPQPTPKQKNVVPEPVQGDTVNKSSPTGESLDDLQNLISKSLENSQTESTASKSEAEMSATLPVTDTQTKDSGKKYAAKEEAPSFEKASVLPTADPPDIWEKDAIRKKSTVGSRKHSAEKMVSQKNPPTTPKEKPITETQTPDATNPPITETQPTQEKSDTDVTHTQKKPKSEPTQKEQHTVDSSTQKQSQPLTPPTQDVQTPVTHVNTDAEKESPEPEKQTQDSPDITTSAESDSKPVVQEEKTAPTQEASKKPVAKKQVPPDTPPTEKESQKPVDSAGTTPPETDNTQQKNGTSNLSALRKRALENSTQTGTDDTEGKQTTTHTQEGDSVKRQRPTSKHASAIAGVADQLHTLSGQQEYTPNSADNVANTSNEATTTNQEQHGEDAASDTPTDTTQQPEQNLPRIRTFKTDVEQTVMKNKTSVVDMVSAEEKRKSLGETVRKAPRSAKISSTSYVLIGASVMLLIAGLSIGGYFGYQYFTSNKEAQTSNIISVNHTIQHDITGQTGDTLLTGLSKVKEALQSNPNDITRFKMMERYSSEETTNLDLVAPRRFFEMLDTKAPGALIRTAGEEMVLGVHTLKKNEAFWVYNVEHYETAFRSMLVWENNMKDDLSPFFVPTEKDVALKRASQDDLFEDVVVGNKEARVLKDDEGETVLLWAIPDTENVIITTNETTFKEIIQRMTARTTY